VSGGASTGVKKVSFQKGKIGVGREENDGATKLQTASTMLLWQDEIRPKTIRKSSKPRRKKVGEARRRKRRPAASEQ